MTHKQYRRCSDTAQSTWRKSAADQLLSEVQDATGLDADLCLVAIVRGQYVLTLRLTRSISGSPGKATWRPHDGPHSPVIMRPSSRSGRPAVKGISTEIIWEPAPCSPRH